MPFRVFPVRAVARYLHFGVCLGSRFRRLWAASTLTNLGDGAFLAAGPLLVASVSTDPLAVGSAVAVQQLPWLLFGLVSGAVVDRFDRRRLVVVVNVVRAVVLGLLSVAILLDGASLAVIYGALFVLGTGETVADNATGTLVVRVVPHDQLGTANARLSAVFTVGNQLAGPPLGAWLFAVSAAAPFGLHALAFAGSALLIATLALPADDPAGTDAAPVRRPALNRQIAEGVRWLWGHRGLRTLTGCIAVMNLTFMAAFATWVLYGTQRLGLTQLQFGFLLTAGAVGGLAGAWLYPRLEVRFGRVLLVRVGLLVEAATHLVLASTTSPAIVYATMTLFGAHAVVWGTVATTVRQRSVPGQLLGRVTSVFFFASTGAAAIGAAVGSLVARTYGLTANFWIASGTITVLTVLAWRPLAAVDTDADDVSWSS